MARGSRYDGAEVASARIVDGRGGEREVSYLRRRLHGTSSAPALAHHRVAEEDRLDLVSARYYGDPMAFWRICDANHALDPDDLVARDAAGRLLVVPAPVV
ncbi:LysM domain-containing protein [Blastococcus sp. BMG 814]|uniref:LysM domain-containing protein n=1 Tax=Blastococcus carthaginiensis TaxID=3050034 RepID=A0ABT9I7P2_9ACTN|nr:LysM domain-containing protein [Blastococcus carthaginiensis]MDP5181586.1 LysM domain-containing protein [Blastococcus carthaginiensis]